MKIYNSLLLCLTLVSGGCMPAEHQRSRPLFHQSLNELYVGKCLELAKAGQTGNVRLIAELIDSGVNANCRGRLGVTPLYWVVASRDFNKKGLVALVRHGADPTLPLTGDGRTGMHYAAQRSDPNVLKALLELGVDPDIASPVTGVVPLHDSADAANTRLLIEHGADVNHLSSLRDRFGPITPAQAAASRLDYESVLMLLDSGADPALGARGGLRQLVSNMMETIQKGYGLDSTSRQYAFFEKVVALLNSKKDSAH